MRKSKGKLRDYLWDNDIQIKAFAESLELTASHLSNYMHGRLRVSKKVARAIERATKGEVTAEDIMKANPPKKSSQKTQI